jgi:biopolymer transport protein ExbD
MRLDELPALGNSSPMTASARDDDEMISGINVTPLVDIALVLLIVFLVTAKLVVSSAQDIVVPPSARGGPMQSPLSLELGADGRVLLGGVPAASDAAIVALAHEAHARDPEARAILRADGSVPHARVVRAIDLLKEGGISRIAFGVDPGAPRPPLVAAPR